ncbi:uncharacterized protein [Hetaerina americana]|uniref:uncharacterized protein isoform X1 n=1 Tax=Hetaerina americana TaxID=62018 RepID=UPI003A7F3FB7
MIMLRNSIVPSSTLKWAVNIFAPSCTPRRIMGRSIVTMNESEVLDNFVETFMTEKMNKWKSKNEMCCKNSLEIPKCDDSSPAGISSYLTLSSVDRYICHHLTSSYLDSILNICRDKQICPSPETLRKTAHALAKFGNKSGMETIIYLSNIGSCGEKMKEEIKIYQAEALWRSGESVQKSLDLLLEVYKSQPGLRRFVHSSMRSLTREVIECRGEASLIQVKDLSLQLAGPPYEDAVPLSFLWSYCILSEWFADQQVSMEIVCFQFVGERDKYVMECEVTSEVPMSEVAISKENRHFRRSLENRLDAVVGRALMGHQVEAVYRVLETLLKLSLYKSAQSVLGKLFDYKYILGDKNGCEAILELSATTNLDIGSTRRKKFENTRARWMNRRNIIIANKKSSTLQHSPKILSVPKYEFKI